MTTEERAEFRSSQQQMNRQFVYYRKPGRLYQKDEDEAKGQSLLYDSTLYEYYEFLEYQKSKERAFVKQQQEHRMNFVKRN